MSEELLNAEEVTRVVDAIIELYPRDKTVLMHRSHFQLLVAVILSAQTTDQAVNRVTPELFDKYPTPEAMKEAPLEEIRKIIQPIGLSNNKSKYLKKMSEMLVEKFDGEVPRTREELMELPGVGRKTANVVLTNGFNIQAFGVDTHIKRVSRRLRFVPKEATVAEVEQVMTEKLPEERWFQAHQSILDFGRYQCPARKHDHTECVERIREVLPEDSISASAYEKMKQAD